MGGVRTGRLAVAASLLILLASGCTSPPDPKPSPTPVVPTPVVPTPVENAQEREQRLAYEAAENSYRTFRAEFRRLLRKGGVATPPESLRAVVGGPYLRDYTSVLSAYKKTGTHETGNEVIGYIHRAGYSPSELTLVACENDRPVDVILKDGSRLGKGEIRIVTLEVRSMDGRWKVWSETTNTVDSCQ